MSDLEPSRDLGKVTVTHDFLLFFSCSTEVFEGLQVHVSVQMGYSVPSLWMSTSRQVGTLAVTVTSGFQTLILGSSIIPDIQDAILFLSVSI